MLSASVGTKHGTIKTGFTRSDLTPCGTGQLLLPTDFPDQELSVRTAASLEAGALVSYLVTARRRASPNAACATRGKSSATPSVTAATCNNEH